MRDHGDVVGQPGHLGLDVLGEDGHVGGHGVQRAHREVGRLREALVAPGERVTRVQGLESGRRISCMTMSLSYRNRMQGKMLWEVHFPEILLDHSS